MTIDVLAQADFIIECEVLTGSEEGTSGEDGDNQRLPPRRNSERSGLSIGRVVWEVVLACEFVDKVGHCDDTVDITRIVAEEDTTKGGEGAHHVRLHGDGGFDTIDIGRRRENGSTRHDERSGILSVTRIVAILW